MTDHRLLPAFTLRLNQRIRTGKVTIGKYDGVHPCLTAATDGNKIFVHCPHISRDDGSASLQFLNANRTVTSLAAGPLDAERGSRDVLVIGTRSEVRAYDVEKNEDLFRTEASDGAHRVAVGCHDGEMLAVVGGNCSIQGFDAEGKERLWTVTGGNVSALSYMRKGTRMLVGSDDYDIRMYDREGHDVVREIAETECVTHLTPLGTDGSAFGYGLRDGTIGVYDKNGNRRWRVKSKHKLTAMASFDINDDGVPEIVSGWSNGCFDVRRADDGSVVYRENLSSAIASLDVCDYRLDGRDHLLCSTVEGEVRGYLPSDGVYYADQAVGRSENRRAMDELIREKQRLQLEVQNIESSIRGGSDEEERKLDDGKRPSSRARRDDLPLVRDDDVIVVPRRNAKAGCVDLEVSVNLTSSDQDAVIRSVVVFATDGSLSSGSRLTFPKIPLPRLVVSGVCPRRDGVETLLRVHVFVATRESSQQCRVVVKDCRLPPLFMFAPISSSHASSRKPQSSLRFDVSRTPKPTKSIASMISSWISSAFGVPSPPTMSKSELSFLSVSTRTAERAPLFIFLRGGADVEIRCDSMDVSAAVFQGICRALELSEIESKADFPVAMSEFRKKTLDRVDELREVRTRQTADMASQSNQVKSLIVRAEDARLLGCMSSLRKAYAGLYSLNNRLIGEFETRCKNHRELMEALRRVNSTIQVSASMRLGKAKSRVIELSRNALRQRRTSSLCDIFKDGRDIAKGSA